MKKNWVFWIVTVGGVGKSSKAPGTFGTVAALPIWWAITLLSPNLYLFVTAALVVFAIYVCNLYEIEKSQHDSQEIVLDEVVGFLVAMAWLPANWLWASIGFLVFRILDIWKPGPIGLIDKKVSGGAGVVLDDVAAGLIANILLHLALRYY